MSLANIESRGNVDYLDGGEHTVKDSIIADLKHDEQSDPSYRQGDESKQRRQWRMQANAPDNESGNEEA